MQWWGETGINNTTVPIGWSTEPHQTYPCRHASHLDSETKLPMRDPVLPQQQGDESLQQRGRKDCEHHAPATTAGNRDAAPSCRLEKPAREGLCEEGYDTVHRRRGQELSSSTSELSHERALSVPQPQTHCHATTSIMLSWPLRQEGRRNVYADTQCRCRNSTPEEPTRHEVLNPRWGRNNLRARQGLSKKHLFWKRAGPRTEPSSKDFLWNRAGLQHCSLARDAKYTRHCAKSLDITRKMKPARLFS